MATFGYGQFEKLGIQKLRDNNKFLAGVPSFQPSITGTGAGTTSAIPGNGYVYQTFYASGTLTVSSPITADVLIVAGGGPGGSNPAPNFNSSGGGGAGGVSYFTSIPLSTGTYTIVVGAAGGADVNGNPSYVQRPNSTLVGFSTGGGAGAIANVRVGNPGGSGGGGSGTLLRAGGTATQPLISNPGGTNYGNVGGNSGGIGGSGGGGAAAAGTAPNNDTGGNGGDGVYLSVGGFSGPLIGLPALAPLNGYFAGGGGGGTSPPSSPVSVGGLGGGGNGSRATPTPTAATNGTAYSGGGGGGGSGGDTNGALGGSGIVVVRYPVL